MPLLSEVTFTSQCKRVDHWEENPLFIHSSQWFGKTAHKLHGEFAGVPSSSCNGCWLFPLGDSSGRVATETGETRGPLGTTLNCVVLDNLVPLLGWVVLATTRHCATQCGESVDEAFVLRSVNDKRSTGSIIANPLPCGDACNCGNNFRKIRSGAHLERTKRKHDCFEGGWFVIDLVVGARQGPSSDCSCFRATKCKVPDLQPTGVIRPCFQLDGCTPRCRC